MKSTQEHLNIVDIREGIILTKDGGAAMVLQTTAVNFDLLSEMEQVSIIQAFAQMLNSLSFPIQIVIRSKRLDITAYLRLLDNAIHHQTNPLLSQLMNKYRHFVQSLIKQNEVLDKEFYLIIPLASLELSIIPQKKEEAFKKIRMILDPKKEQINRQLGRVGIKATQLDSKALLLLFCDIYNPPPEQPTPAQVPQFSFKPQPLPTQQPPPPQPSPIPTPISEPRSARAHPFVVEELIDSI